MLKTNKERVVEFLLQCTPGPPRTRAQWSVDHQGKPFVLPSIGGITLNVAVGDPAFGWSGDHVEPSVSCTANKKKPFDHPNVYSSCMPVQGTKPRSSPEPPKGAPDTRSAITVARNTSSLSSRERSRSNSPTTTRSSSADVARDFGLSSTRTSVCSISIQSFSTRCKSRKREGSFVSPSQPSSQLHAWGRASDRQCRRRATTTS